MEDQIKISKAIRHKLSYRKLAEEIGELLGICSGSAYRSISGETELKMSVPFRIGYGFVVDYSLKLLKIVRP